MPVRNSEKTIGLALESVLNQTHGNLEALVVDDFSEDDSSTIVEAYGDSRIHLLRHNVRRGPGASRNTGIARASGDWIAFIDADDMWIRERLDYLLRAASGFDDVMVCDSISVCVADRGGLKPLYSNWTKEDLKLIRENKLFDLERFLRLSRWTVQPMIPLSLVRRHGVMQPERDYAEDIEFLLRLLHKDVRMVIEEREMYLYRRGHDSISRNPQRVSIFRRTMENLLREFDLTEPEREALQSRIDGLELQEQYLSFVRAMKRGNLARCMKSAAMKPEILAELLRRLPGTLSIRRHQLVDKFKYRKR
jgi:glycosyltransferase involved in cell wall biosynthesis